MKKEDIVLNKDGSIRKTQGRKKSLNDDEKASERIVSYINKNELEDITRIAKIENRTNSYILRQAVQEFIKNSDNK